MKKLIGVLFLGLATTAQAAPPPAPDTGMDLPEGFGETDRFESIDEACLVLTNELAPKKYRRAVGEWCDRRSYASTRGTVVVSRIDGSQIHDRDRPFAWRFYNNYYRRGILDPESCKHHRVDRTIRHPRKSRQLAKKWPFKSGRAEDGTLKSSIATQWFSHPHDMERFGTRGPHDNNMPTILKHLPGCWDPAALDRYDVAATATINRSIAICEKHGCRSKRDIKAHW